ncbi:hypothetical protein ACFXPT_15820 [Streptomyces goshikiensis]|uniref:hypothetical protein n=1 Tax=Streptomyces goshikiensis TaxID=1942 RepID=UPI0036CCB557
MAELMLFRRDTDGRDVGLPGSTVALKVELQRRVEAGLEQMLGIRFLASEYPTGPWHRGRIDTLGLDENGSPVVIEFKKGSNSGVLSQAVSYLSRLESAHHEFEALVRTVLGAEAARGHTPWAILRMILAAFPLQIGQQILYGAVELAVFAPHRVEVTVHGDIRDADLAPIAPIKRHTDDLLSSAKRRRRRRGTV